VGIQLGNGCQVRVREQDLACVVEFLAGDRDVDLSADLATHRGGGQQTRGREADGLGLDD
jgi:hypothetical protein